MPKPSTSRNAAAARPDISVIRKRVLQVIQEKPCGAAEISRKTGYGQGTVRTILQEALTRRLITASGRPVLYAMAKPCDSPTNGSGRMENEYTGTPLPYFRPGSYTRPSRPRVPMFATEVTENDLLAVDAMVQRQELGR